MSRSAGPGSPITFKCARCRTYRRTVPGAGLNYEPTGKTRVESPERGHAPGIRHSSRLAIQYRCIDCKHVGWSRHNDVARKAARLGVVPHSESR